MKIPPTRGSKRNQFGPELRLKEDLTFWNYFLLKALDWGGWIIVVAIVAWAIVHAGWKGAPAALIVLLKAVGQLVPWGRSP